MQVAVGVPIGLDCDKCALFLTVDVAIADATFSPPLPLLCFSLQHGKLYEEEKQTALTHVTHLQHSEASSHTTHTQIKEGTQKKDGSQSIHSSEAVTGRAVRVRCRGNFPTRRECRRSSATESHHVWVHLRPRVRQVLGPLFVQSPLLLRVLEQLQGKKKKTSSRR